MIVINNGANLRYMPYSKGYFTFVPGKNEISVADWESVQKNLRDRKPEAQAVVNTILTVLGGSYDEERKIDVGTEDIMVEFDRNYHLAKKLIENTSDEGELRKYQARENSKEKPRASVLAAIDSQLSVIEAMVSEVEKSKNG